MEIEGKSPMTGMTQEEKDEYIMGKAMEIIMSSGDARNLASQAMNEIAKGNLDEAKALLKDADKLQAAAHNIQTDMIQGDIRGGDEKMGYYVLFAHAQDTLMTIQSEINLTKSMLKIAKNYEARLAALENKASE
ncbi:MAG: PTS lactose/cellobiose transporter subunit IIA [Gemmiger sp.]